jgi:hypothetical protein
VNRDDLIKALSDSDANELALLVAQREEAKRRALEDPTRYNLEAREKAERMVAQYLSGRQAASGQAFKTQTAARDFLDAQGFKVSIQTFNKHFNLGLVSRGEHGFEESALLAYAQANLKAKAVDAREKAIEASAGKSNADQDLKRIMAERHKVKLLKETSQVIPRADHERELAARAQFFKGFLVQFPALAAPMIQALTGCDEAFIPEIARLLERELEAAMDAWAAEREFHVTTPESADG